MSSCTGNSHIVFLYVKWKHQYTALTSASSTLAYWIWTQPKALYSFHFLLVQEKILLLDCLYCHKHIQQLSTWANGIWRGQPGRTGKRLPQRHRLVRTASKSEIWQPGEWDYGSDLLHHRHDLFYKEVKEMINSAYDPAEGIVQRTNWPWWPWHGAPCPLTSWPNRWWERTAFREAQ